MGHEGGSSGKKGSVRFSKDDNASLGAIGIEG